MRGAIEFNESFMGAGEPLKGSRIPGFGAGNRTPDTSRVHKKRAAGQRMVKPTRKGLARSAVVVVRLTPSKFEVRVKGTRALLGLVIKSKNARDYAYQLLLDAENSKVHKGFASQGAAVARMLEKC